jgi:hypothetical protein
MVGSRIRFLFTRELLQAHSFAALTRSLVIIHSWIKIVRAHQPWSNWSLYFERYSFTFHFTKFLSHFLKKLMLNRNYFLILRLANKSFRYCVYILSMQESRKKQLCNKAIKWHKKSHFESVCELETLQHY